MIQACPTVLEAVKEKITVSSVALVMVGKSTKPLEMPGAPLGCHSMEGLAVLQVIFRFWWWIQGLASLKNDFFTATSHHTSGTYKPSITPPSPSSPPGGVRIGTK